MRRDCVLLGLAPWVWVLCGVFMSLISSDLFEGYVVFESWHCGWLLKSTWSSFLLLSPTRAGHIPWSPSWLHIGLSLGFLSPQSLPDSPGQKTAGVLSVAEVWGRPRRGTLLSSCSATITEVCLMTWHFIIILISYANGLLADHLRRTI